MRDLSNDEVDLVGTNQSISYTGGNIVSQFDVARSPYLDSFQHTQNKSIYFAKVSNIICLSILYGIADFRAHHGRNSITDSTEFYGR